MKSLTIFLIPLLLFMTGCTIDWNDEKDKKITELEKQNIELKAKYDGDLFKKKIECQEKYEKIYGPSNRQVYSNLTIEVFYSESRNSCLLRLNGWQNNERRFIIADILAQTTIYSFGVDKDWNITYRNNLEGDLNKLKCDFNYNLRLLGGESYFDTECNPLRNLK